MMRYARIDGAGKPLVLKTGPIPATPDQGLIVRTQYAGICHSDIHFIQDETPVGRGNTFRLRDIIGHDGFRRIIPGHEIAGIIHAVGSDVQNSGLSIGDRVIVYPWKGCGQCADCFQGDTNICSYNLGASTDQGQSPRNSGGYASYVPVDNWQNVIQIPDAIPSQVCDGMASGIWMHAALWCSYSISSIKKCSDSIYRALRVNGKSRLLLLGIGGLGSWCMNLTKHLYKQENVEVVVGDLNKEKVEAAKKSVASDGIHWKMDDSNQEVVGKITENGQRMFDACIDFVGTQATNTIGLDSLAKSGTLVMVGLAGGVMEYPLALLIAREIRIQGMRVAPINVLKDLVKLVGSVQIQPPAIELINLEDINSTLQRLDEGEITGRAIIKYV